jgi:hypothetical protein
MQTGPKKKKKKKNRVKPKFLERNLSQCHIFHYNSHKDCPQIEARISR